ncbi:hypothetical protein OSB04_013797 [Centaurea solstitialis]|uniref:Transmembrane protein n=1 Tax=Centaurea solstitialis TaxID=347529 RepID=A0AA38TDX7_9ASTR|nr:hypothetical protein OSB04_013797 [Centaurea solstitialis]
MAIVEDDLRQVFIPKHRYKSLRDEDKACIKLQRPIVVFIFILVILSIVISIAISLKTVFPTDLQTPPFCKNRTETTNTTPSIAEDHADGDFNLTDQEIIDYYWIVMFVPSAILFLLTAVYLVAGITVAYTAPMRHGCLKVVENNHCAPYRGGVRCLFILNFIFAVAFGILAIFLGSTLLPLGRSGCSIPLFWCYETASWGLAALYGMTASLLRRKTAMALDDGDLGGQMIGVEMLEANPVEYTPEIERRMNEGFRLWIGTSYLSDE